MKQLPQALLADDNPADAGFGWQALAGGRQHSQTRHAAASEDYLVVESRPSKKVCHALASSSAFPVLPCANVLCRWFRFVPNRETRIETRDVALKGSDESVRWFAVSEKRIGMAPGYSKRGVSPS